MTIIGLEGLRQAVTQLPDRVTARLKAVAQASAGRIQHAAQATLDASIAKKTVGVADITVTPDEANRQFIVTAKPAHGRPANLPIWFEYGTVKMAARPFMRPAVIREEPKYLADIEAAAVDVVSEALT